MDEIHLTTVVSADRKLVIQLPDDIPPGPVKMTLSYKLGSVELTMQAETAPDALIDLPAMPHDIARVKLLAVGALVTQVDVPAEPLSVETRTRLGSLPGHAPSSLDLINEDRGEW